MFQTVEAYTDLFQLLVACQETKGIVKAGVHTYCFGGKYTDDISVEK